jgi:large subunit ribosomal protein L10
MTSEILTQSGRKVPERKLKNMKEIKEFFNSNNTLMLISTKNLPDKQLQTIKKTIRGKAVIKFYKKSTLMKALEENQKIKELENDIEENTAVVFSQEDPFKLALMFSENKNPVKAKAGQIIQEDIFVEPGPTEFVPGPIISELNNAKIKFGIENGKISIKARSAIAKKGEKVTLEKASIMDKLDLKPFYVGLSSISAYDKNSDQIYKNLNFSKEEIINNLKEFSRKALNFAIHISYYCKETISVLISKAVNHKTALSGKIKEKTDEKEVENKKAETEKKEAVPENKEDAEKKEEVEKPIEEEKTDNKEETEKTDTKETQKDDTQNKENNQGG